jgi:hypothetical protein
LEPVVEVWQFNFFLLKSDELWPLFCYSNPWHMWKLFFQVKKESENWWLG